MLMFESFESWQSHEMDRHRRQWACQLCGVACKDSAETKSHLVQFHGNIVGQEQIDIIIQASSSGAESLMANECSFCCLGLRMRKNNSSHGGKEPVVPWKKFMRHLGHHLEEFSLLVFPQTELNENKRHKGAESVASDGDKALSNPSSSVLPTVEVPNGDTINDSHAASPPPFEHSGEPL